MSQIIVVQSGLDLGELPVGILSEHALVVRNVGDVAVHIAAGVTSGPMIALQPHLTVPKWRELGCYLL